jgi:hypothetical protein
LQLRHCGPFNPEVRVSPVIGITAVASPLIRDAYPSGEPDAAIDHQQLAMGAVVHAADIIPVQRSIPM